jgi:hypothetical protein
MILATGDCPIVRSPGMLGAAATAPDPALRDAMAGISIAASHRIADDSRGARLGGLGLCTTPVITGVPE